MRRRVGSPEPPSDDQAEEADLAVAHAGRGLGDVGDIVASAPQARNHLPFHTFVGEYPQASAAGLLAEYAENLAGEREGPLDSGQAPRGATPLEPSLLGARCLCFYERRDVRPFELLHSLHRPFFGHVRR
jgi:hypothetical protein